MERATSILEFLTKENPEIKQEKQTETDKEQNTKGAYKTPRQLKEWTEFSFKTLKDMYKGTLMDTAEEERLSLPHYPYLSPETDKTVQCEESTKHVLTKWTHNIVQPALDAVDDRFNACRWHPFAGKKGTLASARVTPAYDDGSSPVPTPSVQSSTSRAPGRPPRRIKPDAGTTLRCRTHGICCPSSSFERLPKEYKPASKWRSSYVTKNRQLIDDNGTLMSGAGKDNVMKPVRQAYTYCVERQCRYGCILTTEEAFIFRIKPRSTSTQMELSTSLKIDGMMEYVSIPWGKSGRNTLTFNLALWFVHILAGNRHEVAYDYDELVDEKLVTETCNIAPTLPVTPQTEPRRSSSRRRQNATSSLRSTSRKRKRIDIDPIERSFKESFGGVPEVLRQP